MLDYLIERENEENLRASARDLTFPDGEIRRIETYRLVWSWFDRVKASAWGPDEETLLDMTLGWARQKSVPVDVAFPELIECVVKSAEELGMDYTDDGLALTIARQRVERFRNRKEIR